MPRGRSRRRAGRRHRDPRRADVQADSAPHTFLSARSPAVPGTEPVRSHLVNGPAHRSCPGRLSSRKQAWGLRPAAIKETLAVQGNLACDAEWLGLFIAAIAVCARTVCRELSA